MGEGSEQPRRGAPIRASAALPATTMKPKRTILCVDDNEQSLSIRKVMLETRGYRVIADETAKFLAPIIRERSQKLRRDHP